VRGPREAGVSGPDERMTGRRRRVPVGTRLIDAPVRLNSVGESGEEIGDLYGEPFKDV
jgi:hypothetical protein